MQIFLRVFFYILIGGLVSACVTIKEPVSPPLSEILMDERVIKFPLKETEQGRWIIDLLLNGTHTATMVIDTGATFSALFKNAVEQYSFDIHQERTVRVHGMVQNDEVPITIVESFGFGQDQFHEKALAVLPKLDVKLDADSIVDGVIGMDIMGSYRIFIDASEEQIYFIPNSLPEAALPLNLISIDLEKNPYTDIGRNLHFFTAYIKNRSIPTLLDTGTVVHVMNWHAANFVETNAIRSMLWQNWKLAGAIGDFKPKAHVNIKLLETDKYQWDDVIMLIKETENLDILGVVNKPFMVAGVSLLQNRDVYLDFENDKLWLQEDGAQTLNIDSPGATVP